MGIYILTFSKIQLHRFLPDVKQLVKCLQVNLRGGLESSCNMMIDSFLPNKPCFPESTLCLVAAKVVWQ